MKPPFESVVKDYIRLVYFFAKKSLSQQEDVDDAVQETKHTKTLTLKAKDSSKAGYLLSADTS